MALKERDFLLSFYDAMAEAEELAALSIGRSRAYSKRDIKRLTRERLARRWDALTARTQPAFDPVDPKELARSFYLDAPDGTARAGKQGQQRDDNNEASVSD
jgi:hypothetical protein